MPADGRGGGHRTAAQVSQIDLRRRICKRPTSRGEISSREFYDGFCRQTGTKPEYAALLRAASESSRSNRRAGPWWPSSPGRAIGWASFPTPATSHWEHCRGRYALLGEAFSVYALSYQIGAMKPDAAIFQRGGRAGRLPARGDLLHRRHCPVTWPAPGPWASTPCSSPRRRNWRSELCRRGVRIDGTDCQALNTEYPVLGTAIRRCTG